ncbi:MAG TPA: M48 family metalloprotease [Thermoanaerobaculia bacterium]|nr:M48 family metalloprotease [Thermoanaerobaculia bacterium]
MRFLSRSLLILLALYGLVFAVGDALLAHGRFPLWSAIVFAVASIGIQFLIGPWLVELLLKIRWDDGGTLLPARNREFLERLCRERGLKVPRIGVIRSGTPNAFSFGHVPGNARVVVTDGLLDVLTPEEANAVLAHEIGHVEHWDFVVMTVAALAPLLLYQIYVFTSNISNTRAVAFTAYLCYWVSQFIVLSLNRTREYFADHYASEVTRAPDTLASALVKIAYGMVKADGEYSEALQSKETRADARRAQRLAGTVAVMGISSLRSGSALALAGADAAAAAAVMRWDLVNPWARVYELSSTHPLTALRVRALNEDATAMRQAVRYQLPEERRIRWGKFPVEVLLWAAPWLCAAALAAALWHPEWVAVLGSGLATDTAQPLLLIVLGVAWILRISYRYRGRFENCSVGSLLEDVEVSQMRPRAVRLKGEILGRGVPGAFWSPDLVLRDSTGILFVLYRQSIPFARFLFALTEAESYIGRHVEIEGWFRRGLRPYIEMARLTGEEGASHRAYSRWVQYVVAGIAIVGGLLWLYG